MLHPLNSLPPEIEAKLLALIDRQRDLLEFAVRNATFDIAVFRTELGDDFADWLLLDQYTGVRINLERLIACAHADKELVLSDFDHDQEFWLDEDPAFRFVFEPQKTTAHQTAKLCLNLFFDRFYGFEYLLPDGTGIRKRDIYEGYVATNPTLRSVCAFCDGSMKRDRMQRQSRDYTLEHFFHKEMHPSICLHPYNLIPCCEVCNDERNDQEVLELDGRMLALGEIFHPILRPARERVELRYYSHGLEPEDIEFVKIHSEDWSIGVEMYHRLYRIPARWKELWPDIDGVINSRLRGAVDSHWYSKQTGISLIDFEQMIHSVIWSLQNYSSRYEYPAHYWLIWARNERRKIEQLYQSQVVSRGFQATEAQ